MPVEISKDIANREKVTDNVDIATHNETARTVNNIASPATTIMLAKKSNTDSNSSLAQGGVAAVLDLENDSYELHINDTMIAGKHANDIEAVTTLVEEGPAEIYKIIDYGVEFDKRPDGELNMTLEGGHCRRRIVHHKDTTGAEMVRAMVAEAQKRENITIVENTPVFKLTRVKSGICAHILTEDGQDEIFSSYCVLATGGIGRVYKYTTNPKVATGDGIRLAFELGARIKDLSYVQFHPTAFNSDDNEQFLISEAVRGEGAYLLNCNKERFMHRYDERLELAPRDVVSKSIIIESRRTGSNNFYLDITHRDKEYLLNRFPGIHKGCLKYNVDITKDLIPIFPCQHYLMGGIEVDLNSRTTISRLYAVGECSNTGVHGKNRLASNSLLEALVFGKRCADDIVRCIDMKYPEVKVCEVEKQDLDGAPLLKGDGEVFALAFAFSLAIALQNIPEGAIISLPLHSLGTRKRKAFLWGALSGAVEPLGTLITLAVTKYVSAALPFLFGFAAGAMLFVVEGRRKVLCKSPLHNKKSD